MNSISPPTTLLHLRGGGLGSDAKRRVARKRKFAPSSSSPPAPGSPPALEEEISGPRGKKRRRVSEEEEIAEEGDAKEEVAEEGEGEEGKGKGKAQRFIVFIGNLPYTTTSSALATHFRNIYPVAIRHVTEKGGEGKGFAFLEFEAYDRMKTCLRLYHHSVFEDGVSKPRRINVELTVGGGGAKSKERKTKLKAKNWKLSEERRRRGAAGGEGAQAEKKKKKRARKKSGEESSRTDVGKENAEAENGDIHPSRRSRVTMR